MKKIVLASLLTGGLILGSVATVTAHEGGLSTKLNGEKEVPGPGDPDATGRAHIDPKPKKGQVCFEITYQGMKKPNLGHIHEGDKETAGPPVVTLFEGNENSPIEGCVDAEKALLKQIKENPNQFYVNLHNGEYPNGAIRGNLKKA